MGDSLFRGCHSSNLCGWSQRVRPDVVRAGRPKPDDRSVAVVPGDCQQPILQIVLHDPVPKQEGPLRDESDESGDRDSFPDYTGPEKDFDAGVNYFTKEFLSKSADQSKEIFVHVTCATDTGNVKVVFEACKDTILKANLLDSGFSF